jgi:hypothetical protein
MIAAGISGDPNTISDTSMITKIKNSNAIVLVGLPLLSLIFYLPPSQPMYNSSSASCLQAVAPVSVRWPGLLGWFMPVVE